VEQSYVDQLYREISELRIELEPDPTILGARYIQGVTSKCRNYLNRVALIRVQLNQKKRNLMVQVAGEETSISIERSRLLAEDTTVRRGSNITDREAIVATILHQQINRVSTLKVDLLDIDTVDKAVKMIHDELIRTSQEIKVQRSLLFSDRVSGAGYGDETSIGSSLSSPPEVNEGELDELIKGTVPLVKDSAPEEEDSDLLAALASIEDEDVIPEVKLSAEYKVKAQPRSEVPQEVRAFEVGVLVAEEDLSDFLEGKPAPSKASAKKPNSSDDKVSKVALTDVDLDFSDILSNV
jgi:hypothetical protein